jgi:D-alanyl-D-alanine carboxypeptidase
MLSRVIRSGSKMVKVLRGLAFVGIGIAALAMAPGQAQANAKYAGIVVDVKTGKVLYARNADAARYPASLTKMMTLYVLFEELEAGRLKLNSRLKISKYAAARPPSKIGLKAGSTISVRNAISALVTKSANDIATAIAENISGTQEAFGRRMTATARRIGMRRTTFRNASGLPDSRQKTTARDMARLGMALQDHFPKQYKYFSMRSFKFNGRKYGNHNRLLGRVKGVDGIKTGYTRASGFNLVTNVRHRDRHIVAVVMGGRTGKSRNAQMQKLIEGYLAKARTGKRRTPMIAGRANAKHVVIAKAPLPTAKPTLETQTPIVVAAAIPPVAPPAAPKPSKKGADEAAELTVASISPVPTPTARISAAHELNIGATGNGPLSLDATAKMPKRPPMPAELSENDKAPLLGMAPPANIPDAAAAAADKLANAKPAIKVAAVNSKPATIATPPSGWQVQIAAAQSEEGAMDLLKSAKSKAGKALAGRALYTEQVEAKGETLYRARFVGFTSKASAKAACRSLKRAKFACYHLHQ